MFYLVFNKFLTLVGRFDPRPSFYCKPLLVLHSRQIRGSLVIPGASHVSKSFLSLQ
jgi:hypothetical protein